MTTGFDKQVRRLPKSSKRDFIQGRPRKAKQKPTKNSFRKIGRLELVETGKIDFKRRSGLNHSSGIRISQKQTPPEKVKRVTGVKYYQFEKNKQMKKNTGNKNRMANASFEDIKEYMKDMVALNGQNSVVIRQLVDTVAQQNSRINDLTSKMQTIIPAQSMREQTRNNRSPQNRNYEPEISFMGDSYYSGISEPNVSKSPSNKNEFLARSSRPRLRPGKATKGKSLQKGHASFLGSVDQHNQENSREKIFSFEEHSENKQEKVEMLQKEVRTLTRKVEQLQGRVRELLKTQEILKKENERLKKVSKELRTENKFVSQVNRFYKDLLRKQGCPEPTRQFKTFRDQLRSSLSPDMFNQKWAPPRVKAERMPCSSSANKVARHVKAPADKRRNLTRVRQKAYQLEMDFSRPSNNIYGEDSNSRFSFKINGPIEIGSVDRNKSGRKCAVQHKAQKFDAFSNMFRKKETSMHELSGRSSEWRLEKGQKKPIRKAKTKKVFKFIPLVKRVRKVKKGGQWPSREKLFNSQVVKTDKPGGRREWSKMRIVNGISFRQDKKSQLRNYSKRVLSRVKKSNKRGSTRAKATEGETAKRENRKRVTSEDAKRDNEHAEGVKQQNFFEYSNRQQTEISNLMSRDEQDPSSRYESVQKGPEEEEKKGSRKLNFQNLGSLNYSDTNIETPLSRVNSKRQSSQRDKFVFPFGKGNSERTELGTRSSTFGKVSTVNMS